MVSGFVLIIAMGHFYSMLLPIFLTCRMYYELLSLQREPEREKKINSFFFKNMVWYYMFLAVFYFYFVYFNDRLLTISPGNPVLQFFVHYYRIIGFGLHAGGLVGFILSLKSGEYGYQYRVFGWIHFSISITILCSVCFAANIYRGMVWFALPGFLIIVNDAAAYLFGITFGRTPLISVSPKKTWEGFLGGFFSTLVIGHIVPLLNR